MPSSPATLSNLLTQMYQDQEVLQGWDAVMNLLETSVNSFFQAQWNKQTAGAGQMSISTIWCEGVQTFHGTTFTNVTQFNVVLGPPLFQFQSGQASVTVTQKILGGTLTIGTKTVAGSFSPPACGCQVNDPSVQWGTPQTINTASNPTLTGTVALGQVQGMIANGSSLILDFAKGSFTLNQLSVQGVPNTTIVNQLVNWFATNEIKYTLASLNFQNLTGQASLTPRSFQFNVVTTNSGNTIVQLLIMTDGTQPQTSHINVDEPIPTGDGLTCSLMISSRILYQTILVAGFNQGGAPFQLYASSPSSVAQSWSAAISPQMHFSGQFSFGSCCDRTTVTYSIYLGGNYNGSPTSGFVLSQHVTTQGNASVNIDVSASYPVTLSGSGPNQRINITPGTPSVSVTGSVEGEIKSTLENILNTNLRNSMAGISFGSVTAFALENLVFPGNLMSMSQVQAPADLLIVGTFAGG